MTRGGYSSGKVARKLMLDAAVKIGRRDGVLGINARSVGDATGKAPGSIFYHFRTIEKLRRAAVDVSAETYRDDPDAAMFLASLIASGNPMVATLPDKTKKYVLTLLVA